MKKLITSIAVSIMMIGSAAATFAADATFQMEIPSLLSVSFLTTGDVDLTGANAISTAEILAGVKMGIDGGSLIADANVPYDIFVKADAADFASVGAGVKSVNDLKVIFDGGAPTALNGTTDVLMVDNHAVGSGIGAVVTYDLNLSTSDAPDTYTSILTYTILAH